GYATGASPSYAYTLINPVKVTRFDRRRRVTDEIQATRASTTGALSPADSFPQSGWVRWTSNHYDNHNRLTFQRMYFLIPSSGDGSLGTNYNQTDFGYDVLQRQNR